MYNAKELTHFASKHTQELVELEMKALMNDVPTLGPNAHCATVDKFGVLSSLRISIQQARPGIITTLTTH